MNRAPIPGGVRFSVARIVARYDGRVNASPLEAHNRLKNREFPK
jgi:hypothetical protein